MSKSNFIDFKVLGTLILALLVISTNAQTADVVWTDLVQATVSGNTITETAVVNDYVSGARSTVVLGAGQNGYVEVNCIPGSTFFIGLSSSNTNILYTSIDFAVLHSNGSFSIYESGNYKTSYSPNPAFQATDKIKVERVGSTIYYRYNAVTIYTSTVSSTTSLFADCTIAGTYTGTSNYITGARVSFGTVSVPTAPSNLVAATVNESQINLSWADNSTNEDGFQIERSLTAGTGFSLIATVPANTITFQNTTLNAGTKYYYRIRASNTPVFSAYTAEVNATTDALGLWNANGNNIFNKNTGNVGIGTTTPDAKLAVNGTIHSKEVKVDLTGWPDYVFNDDYKLLSLSEIKSYIDKNKHLPEVPSAKEIEANGVNLGEMNMLLLKKIEELTLHIIELEKRVKTIENKN